MTDSIDAATGFGVFMWRGQKRYKCNQVWESGAPCEYDTHDLSAMFDHIRQPHNRTGKIAIKTRTVSPLVDAEGKAIIKEEEPVQEFKDYNFKQEE